MNGDFDKIKHNLPEKAIYNCEVCSYNGDESRFIAKILSVSFRARKNDIQSFTQIKCPKCNNLITIIFETIECEKKEKNDTEN